jgi:hypothetical protein
VEDWLLCRFDCSSRGSVDCKHGREELVFPDGGLLFTAFDRIRYMGVLVLAGIASSVPYRRHQVTLGQTFFWILLVPIVVFVLLSLLPFRFPITITEIPTVPNAGWMKP